MNPGRGGVGILLCESLLGSHFVLPNVTQGREGIQKLAKWVYIIYQWLLICSYNIVQIFYEKKANNFSVLNKFIVRVFRG
jgi:hypothetical protein